MSFRDLMTDDIFRSNVVLVGIPYDKSTSIKSGASEAPKTLRELSEYLPPYTMLMNDIKPIPCLNIPYQNKYKRLSYYIPILLYYVLL